MRMFPLFGLFLALVSCVQPYPTLSDEDPVALETDRTEYAWRRTERMIEADIGYRLTNRSAETLHLARCHSIYPPSLQKRVDDRWVTVYSPVVLLCYQEPIPVRPGATHADTLRVRAGLPGSNVHPRLEAESAAGTYRLVWRLVASDGGDPRENGKAREFFSNPFQMSE